MDQKRNHLIKSSLKDTPRVDRKINERLVGEFAKYTSEASDKDFELVIEGVEKDKRPNILRKFGAMAAAAVLVAGIGGGTLLIKNAGTPDDPMSGDVNSTTAPIEVTEPFIIEDFDRSAYEMETKEDVYFKMLNSFMFFDQVSGKNTYMVNKSDDNDNLDCTVSKETFFADLTKGTSLTDKTEYYTSGSFDDVLFGHSEYSEGKDICSENGIGSGNRVMNYCYEDDIIMLNPVDKKYISYIEAFSSVFGEPIGHISGRKDTIIPWEKAQDFILNNRKYILDQTYDEHNPFSNVETGINDPDLLPYYLNPVSETNTDNCLITEDFSNFDNWEITGATKYLDRVCTIISFDNKENTTGELYVDNETGVLLKFVKYNRTIFQCSFTIDELNFDSEAYQVPVPPLEGCTNITDELKEQAANGEEIQWETGKE